MSIAQSNKQRRVEVSNTAEIEQSRWAGLFIDYISYHGQSDARETMEKNGVSRMVN